MKLIINGTQIKGVFLRFAIYFNRIFCQIKCSFLSEWYKVDTYASYKEMLLSEIKKNNPDVVLMDLNLYAKIDGIEIGRNRLISLHAKLLKWPFLGFFDGLAR